MSRVGETWQLRHMGELLADLTVTDTDFPWVSATVEVTEAFTPWRARFDEERLLLDDERFDEWEAAYAEIAEQLTLYYPTGERVPEFLLHIEGREARWRWFDEPFLRAAE